MSGQRLYFPELHVLQFRHGTPASSATRSPTCTFFTFFPTFAITPAASCPSTIGFSMTKCPMRPCCQ
eukprot:gene4154-biopygen4085